jgi:hypothetical protein
MRQIFISTMPALFFLVLGCGHTKPGVIQSGDDTPLVTITAGKVYVPTGWVIASYIIDPQTRSCWFRVGDQLAPLPCERLAGVRAAARVLNWLPERPEAAPATAVPEPPPADDAEMEPPPAPMRGGAAAAEDL